MNKAKIATGLLIGGIGAAIFGVVRLARDPVGLGFLLGGAGAGLIAVYLLGVHFGRRGGPNVT